MFYFPIFMLKYIKKLIEGGVSITVQINIFTAIILFFLSLLGICSLFSFTKKKGHGGKSSKELELNFIKKTKYLLREQRHDYMNVFQIIYGYLQLNNKDMAIEYIKKSINLSLNSSKCFCISIFSISLLLEKKMKLGESKGIEIIYDVDSCVNSEIRDINDESGVIDYISKLFDFFFDCTYNGNQGAKLFIEVYEHIDKIEFVFSGDIDISLFEQNSRGINNITKVDDGYEVVLYFDKTKDLLVGDNICSISNSY